MATLRWITVGFLVLTLTACGGSSGGTTPSTDTGVPDTGAPDTGAPDVGTPDVAVPDTAVPLNPTWTVDIKPIVDASCSGGGCHTDGSAAAGVNLDTYAKTQEMSANTGCYPNLTVGAVLALKVAPNPPCGIQMPIAKPLLSQDEQHLFQGWVDSGMLE